MSRCRIKDLHDSKPDKKQNRHEEGRPEGGDFLSQVGQEKGDTDGKRQNVFGEIDRHVVAKVFSRQILEQEPDQEEIQAVSPTIERGDDEGRADKEQDNVREAGHIAGDDKNCDMTGLAYVVLLFIGAAFVIATLNSWRNGLYFFLIWLLFEDLPRKYLGNNMAIYFAKDVLALAVCVSFFLAYLRKEVTSFRPPFLVPVLLFVWFGVMQIFNPASTHLIYGVLGFKLFFYYIPLLFVGYAFLNSEEQLRRFFFVNMVLVMIIASLGIAQSRGKQ